MWIDSQIDSQIDGQIDNQIVNSWVWRTQYILRFISFGLFFSGAPVDESPCDTLW